MRLDDATAIIDQNQFFSICSDEQKRMLAFASEQAVLRQGEYLFRKGDVPRGAYILIEGALSAVDEAEEAQPVAGAGDIVAELALLAEHPRRANLQATERTELLMVPRESFKKLMQQFPEVAAYARDRIQAELNDYVQPIVALHSKLAR